MLVKPIPRDARVHNPAIRHSDGHAVGELLTPDEHGFLRFLQELCDMGEDRKADRMAARFLDAVKEHPAALRRRAIALLDLAGGRRLP
jgi:hypothetical protein